MADWSYESLATSKTKEILNLELKTGNRGVHYLNGDELKALEAVDPRDLRDLVVWLTVHHLRIARRLDAVSQETVERE